MSSGAATPTVGAAPKENESRSAYFDDSSHNEAARPIAATSTPQRLISCLAKIENQLVEYSLEARGIERVQEHERIPKLSWISYLQASLLWISVNLAANNITLGMLGPAVYALSFLDSALCAVFGALLGSLASSWMATWGPISGIRTMVCYLCNHQRAFAHNSQGFRAVHHGVVAKQTDCDIEPHSNDWILFDQLCRLRTDSLCSVPERKSVGGSW